MKIYQALIIVAVVVVLVVLRPVPLPLPESLDSAVADVSVAAGDLFASGELYSAAIPCYDLAYHVSGNPETLVRKGDAALADNDTALALESYDAAIAASPNLTAAYIGKGTLFLGEGDRAQATAMFSEALAIDPDQPQALGMQGLSLLEEGRYGEAIAYFDRIVALDPENPRAYLSRGDAHLLVTTRLEGLMEEEYLNATGRFDPSSLSGEAADHYRQAVSDYNRAMMLDPALTPVVTLRVLGKTQASVTHFQNLLNAM